MASIVYPSAKVDIFNGTQDWDTHDMRAALVASGYTQSAAHDRVDDLTNELSGGNYVRKALTESVAADGANAKFDATDIVETALQAAAGTPDDAVVFKFDTDDATSRLTADIELTAPPVPNGGDYTIAWHANGIVLGS